MVDDHDGISYLDHEGETIAYQAIAGSGPGLVFLSGFGSDMSGSKASHLALLARKMGIAFTRLDYSGHGRSSGDFRQGNLTRWLSDALAVFDRLTEGPQIVIGSSMGGWLALHVALARPDRVKALVGIAAAPDFTQDLIWDQLSEAQRAQLQSAGFLEVPSEYGAPQIITMDLIRSGAALRLLSQQIDITCPVRLIHGMRDRDVPHEISLRLAQALATSDVQIHLVKDGEHRLSRDTDLALLARVVFAEAEIYRLFANTATS